MPQKSNALHDVIRICKAWHGLNSTDINKFFSSFSRQNPISLTRHAKPAHLCSFLTHHRPCSGQSSKHSQAFSATLPPLPTHTHTHTLTKVALFALFSFPWLSYFFFSFLLLQAFTELPNPQESFSALSPPSSLPGNIPPLWLYVYVLVIQSCPTLCDPMDYSPPGCPVHGILLHALLQGFCPAQGSNPRFLHCRQSLYHWATREEACDYITPRKHISVTALSHSVGNFYYLCLSY